MAKVYELSPLYPLTVKTIQDIISQNSSVSYTPGTVASAAVASAPANLSPADLAAVAMGLGAEVPAEIVRLMLVLQADYFLKTPSPVPDGLVLKLLEFYQFEILPQVFTQGLFATPTAHLLLPVFGEGKVYFQGYLLKAADVYDIFSWQPIPWPASLPESLFQASSFGLSYLVYCFTQFKRIYQFTQILFSESGSSHQDNLFPAQIKQLEDQLNTLLAHPSEQQMHINGLSFQVEKLLAKFSEQVAAYQFLFSDRPVSENSQIKTGTMQQLATTLALENMLLYETGHLASAENTTSETNRLLIQSYQILQNLEKIAAVGTLAYFTERLALKEEIYSPGHLALAYRDQVLNVLKETVFAELIQKTIGFMYATTPDF